MDRNLIQFRLTSLKQQESEALRMLEQMQANVHAIRGAMQFAEDLLKDLPPAFVVAPVPQADGDSTNA
jgi:hypothetical protein